MGKEGLTFPDQSAYGAADLGRGRGSSEGSGFLGKQCACGFVCPCCQSGRCAARDVCGGGEGADSSNAARSNSQKATDCRAGRMCGVLGAHGMLPACVGLPCIGALVWVL